jgi:hypothetical protein
LHVQRENQRRERDSHTSTNAASCSLAEAAKPPRIIVSIIRGEILVALRNLRQAAGVASIFPLSVAKMRHFAHASDFTKQRSND